MADTSFDYTCPVHGTPLVPMFDDDPHTQAHKVAYRCDRCFGLWDFVKDNGRWHWTEVTWREADRRRYYRAKSGSLPEQPRSIIVPGAASPAGRSLIVPHG